VLKRGGSNRIVYKYGGAVVKVLRADCPAEIIKAKIAIIEQHPDIFAVTTYDARLHRVVQEWMGDEYPRPRVVKSLQAEIVSRGLSVHDISPANVRGGKIIDFDTFAVSSAWRLPSGIHRFGRRTVVANRIDEGEARSLGGLIAWPASR